MKRCFSSSDIARGCRRDKRGYRGVFSRLRGSHPSGSSPPPPSSRPQHPSSHGSIDFAILQTSHPKDATPGPSSFHDTTLAATATDYHLDRQAAQNFMTPPQSPPPSNVPRPNPPRVRLSSFPLLEAISADSKLNPSARPRPLSELILVVGDEPQLRRTRSFSSPPARAAPRHLLPVFSSASLPGAYA
jgi:hypothetical protein